MGSRAARDMGLARIGTTTRWLAAGTLVAGGALSAVAARTLPGRSSHSAGSATPTTTPAQSPTTVTPAGSDGTPAGSGGGLSAPVQAPQPVQSAPVVNSGGS